jgi:hypothetical protein
MVDRLGIKSVKDVEKLKAAKDEVYLKGFYEVCGKNMWHSVCGGTPLIMAPLTWNAELRFTVGIRLYIGSYACWGLCGHESL